MGGFKTFNLLNLSVKIRGISLFYDVFQSYLLHVPPDNDVCSLNLPWLCALSMVKWGVFFDLIYIIYIFTCRHAWGNKNQVQFSFFAKLKFFVRTYEVSHWTALHSVTNYVWSKNRQLFPQNSRLWISIISKLSVHHEIRRNKRKEQ